MGFEFLQENAFMRGYWRQSLEYAARHRELGEKAHSSDRLAWNYLPVSYANYGLGDLAVAGAACDDGLEIADRLGDERLAAFFAGWRALITAEQGRIDEAVLLADGAIKRADTLGLKQGQLDCRRARACIAHLQGDHEVVLELTGRMEELLEGTDESIQPVWMNPTRCQSLIATGQLDEAEQRLETTLEAARRADMPHWVGVALQVRGRLHIARGDQLEALKDLDAATAIFEELGSRLELARTLVVRAEVGESRDDDIRRAHELFEACGVQMAVGIDA